MRAVVPGGLWRTGEPAPVREFALRPAGAEDEAFLLETAARLLPGERATALLARCLTGGEHVTPALTVGDREALLLQLRLFSIGDAVSCVLSCPVLSCHELMDVELRVRELLLRPYQDVRPSYDVSAVVEGVRYDVSYRLPTAGDLDHVAGLARSSPEAGAVALLRRCVLRAKNNDEPTDATALPDSVGDAVAAAMAETDPQAELLLELCCTACGTTFSALFDAATFLLDELDQRADRLLHEVHALALAYHWSESDILGLAPDRRARYLAFLHGTAVKAVAR